MTQLPIKDFSSNTHVEKVRDERLKLRLKTLISAKGLSQADFYKSLGFGRDYWYLISWGKIKPALDVKVKIAQALGVDSSVIWEEARQ